MVSSRTWSESTMSRAADRISSRESDVRTDFFDVRTDFFLAASVMAEHAIALDVGMSDGGLADGVRRAGERVAVEDREVGVHPRDKASGAVVLVVDPRRPRRVR